MSTTEPVKAFLDGLTHLVLTAETYSVPRSVDEYHTALQARADAENLIDHTQQTLMFLMQRVKKLPALPPMSQVLNTYLKEMAVTPLPLPPEEHSQEKEHSA